MVWLLGMALAESPVIEAPSEELTVVDETSGVQHTVVQRRPPPEKSYRTEALSVAALLALLLLSRVNRRKAVVRRASRRTPLSVDELGRAAFQAARSADLDLFRALFLTGGEAARLLGTDQADQWLQQRSNAVLLDSLAALAVYCAPGTTLYRAHLSGELLVLTVRAEASGEREVPVATVRQVGPAYRFFEPLQG